MACQLTSSNWGSFPAGREKCSAGACPQLGAECVAQTTPDPSINQCTQFSCFRVPAPAGMSDWYENALKRLSSAPANPSIRHSREGGNPRTNIPRKNAKRDTTTYVHTGTPLRHSRPLISSFRRQPESCSAGACPPLRSGWGVAESDVPIRCTKPHLRVFTTWCAGRNRHERLARK